MIDENEIEGFDFWYSLFVKTKKEVALGNRELLLKFGKFVDEEFRSKFENIEEKHNGSFAKEGNSIFIEKSGYFRFPSFNYTENKQHIEIRIDINPCITAGTSTKIYTIPRWKGRFEYEDIFKFYDKAEVVSKDICEDIYEQYFNIVREFSTSEEINLLEDIFGVKEFSEVTRYELKSHVIGSKNEAFKELIDKSNNLKDLTDLMRKRDVRILLHQIINIIKRISNSLTTGKYNWFTQTTTHENKEYKGLFGFYGSKKFGHFLGITDGYPHKTATLLNLEIIKTV